MAFWLECWNALWTIDWILTDNGDNFWLECYEFLFWFLIHGPDNENSIEAKTLYYQALWHVFSWVAMAFRVFYSSHREVCRRWDHMFMFAAQLVWTFFSEAWQLSTQAPLAICFLKELGLASYWSIQYGPRFLWIFYDELRANLVMVYSVERKLIRTGLY